MKWLLACGAGLAVGLLLGFALGVLSQLPRLEAARDREMRAYEEVRRAQTH